MKLFGLFRRRPRNEAAALYRVVVEQARLPRFYLDHGVPDTVDGRFDMIALHAFLVLHRLKQDHAQTATLAQDFFDLMFADMDENLREMGAGDLGVGKRIKSMAEAFYGRVAAYEAGSAGDDADFGEALRRNLFRDASPPDEDVTALVRYMRVQVAALDIQATEKLLAGEVQFVPPPSEVKPQPGKEGTET